MSQCHFDHNFFALFNDFDFVVDQVLSFCDFKGLVALGMTSSQMKSCSDNTLNKIVKEVSVCTLLHGEDIAELEFQSSTQTILMKLKRYWSNFYKLHDCDSMVDLALRWIRQEMITERMRGVTVVHDDEFVRNHLLRNGNVRLFDLAPNYFFRLSDPGPSRDENFLTDWRIEIKDPYTISVVKAHEL